MDPFTTPLEQLDAIEQIAPVEPPKRKVGRPRKGEVRPPRNRRKGRRVPMIQKIPLEMWGSDGVLTIRVPVGEPKLSASKKCYLFGRMQGESEWMIPVAGKDRNVRVSVFVYSKVPLEEQKALAAQVLASLPPGDAELS